MSTTKSTDNIYYVYEYLREDGTPYYVGKGKNGRAYSKEHNVAVPPKERIQFVSTNLTEEQAFALEKELILKYGRKDLGTGLLRNLTTGGEGASPGPELRKAQSERMKGIIPWNKGKTYKQKVKRQWDRQGEKHPMYGQSHTEEARRKISEGIKANWSRPVQTCPHCGKQGKVSMTRWHFDNCRHK